MSKSKFLSCVKSDGQFGFCSVIFGWDRRSPMLPFGHGTGAGTGTKRQSTIRPISTNY